MKKNIKTLIFCLVAILGLTMVSCSKENSSNNGDSSQYKELIIGHWRLDAATQHTEEYDSDYSPVLGGTEFQLTFKEGGKLILFQLGNTAEMEYTLEGDQLGFIQAPGVSPVMYTITLLNQTNLTIKNGDDTAYTIMELHRE